MHQWGVCVWTANQFYTAYVDQDGSVSHCACDHTNTLHVHTETVDTGRVGHREDVDYVSTLMPPTQPQPHPQPHKDEHVFLYSRDCAFDIMSRRRDETVSHIHEHTHPLRLAERISAASNLCRNSERVSACLSVLYSAIGQLCVGMLFPHSTPTTLTQHTPLYYQGDLSEMIHTLQERHRQRQEQLVEGDDGIDIDIDMDVDVDAIGDENINVNIDTNTNAATTSTKHLDSSKSTGRTAPQLSTPTSSSSSSDADAVSTPPSVIPIEHGDIASTWLLIHRGSVAVLKAAASILTSISATSLLLCNLVLVRVTGALAHLLNNQHNSGSSVRGGDEWRDGVYVLCEVLEEAACQWMTHSHQPPTLTTHIQPPSNNTHTDSDSEAVGVRNGVLVLGEREGEQLWQETLKLILEQLLTRGYMECAEGDIDADDDVFHDTMWTQRVLAAAAMLEGIIPPNLRTQHTRMQWPTPTRGSSHSSGSSDGGVSVGVGDWTEELSANTVPRVPPHREEVEVDAVTLDIQRRSHIHTHTREPHQFISTHAFDDLTGDNHDYDWYDGDDEDEGVVGWGVGSMLKTRYDAYVSSFTPTHTNTDNDTDTQDRQGETHTDDGLLQVNVETPGGRVENAVRGRRVMHSTVRRRTTGLLPSQYTLFK